MLPLLRAENIKPYNDYDGQSQSPLYGTPENRSGLFYAVLKVEMV